MRFNVLAGLGGIGFVLIALVVNVVYLGAGLPLPASGESLAEVTDAYAAVGDAMKWSSVIAPVPWLFTTVFAVGLVSVLWRPGSSQGAWALVGLAGVLMQNATFTSVEALRFGMAAAAPYGPDSVAGLWGLSNVLFGFNQVFLAIALLGFTTAGVAARFIPAWHAVLGYAAAMLFLSSLASPYAVDGGNPPRSRGPDRMVRLGRLDRGLQHHRDTSLPIAVPGQKPPDYSRWSRVSFVEVKIKAERQTDRLPR